jgi:senataxin
MAKREVLLDRWRTIEEEEELHANDGDNPVIRRRLHLLKEQWSLSLSRFLPSISLCFYYYILIVKLGLFLFFIS